MKVVSKICKNCKYIMAVEYNGDKIISGCIAKDEDFDWTLPEEGSELPKKCPYILEHTVNQKD
jgi:hypothetical protein